MRNGRGDDGVGHLGLEVRERASDLLERVEDLQCPQLHVQTKSDRTSSRSSPSMARPSREETADVPCLQRDSELTKVRYIARDSSSALVGLATWTVISPCCTSSGKVVGVALFRDCACPPLWSFDGVAAVAWLEPGPLGEALDSGDGP